MHYLLQTRPILVVHSVENFARYPVGKLLQNIGDIIVLQALGNLGDLRGIHVAEEIGLQVIAELVEDLPFFIDFHHLPKNVAEFWWRGF